MHCIARCNFYPIKQFVVNSKRDIVSSTTPNLVSRIFYSQMLTDHLGILSIRKINKIIFGKKKMWIFVTTWR